MKLSDRVGRAVARSGNATGFNPWLFVYIAMGFWFDSRFMIVLGLVVMAATLVGFFF